MVNAIHIVNQVEDIGKSDSFNTEQLVNSAIFGSYSGLMATFDSSKTYNRGDKVPFLTDNGEVLILVCNKNDVTGAFKATDWDEWNIVDELNGVYNELFIMSWNEPTVRRNKIWIEVKNESLEAVRGLNMGNETGLLIYRNLTVSTERPSTFTEDIIWGQIRE